MGVDPIPAFLEPANGFAVRGAPSTIPPQVILSGESILIRYLYLMMMLLDKKENHLKDKIGDGCLEAKKGGINFSFPATRGED